MFSLKNKTVRVGVKIALGVAVFIVLHIIARQVIFLPLDNAKKEIESAQGELSRAEKLIKDNSNPRKRKGEILEKMDELRRKSVSDKELPRIIQQLTKKSSELDMEIISIRPIEEINFTERALPQGVSKAYIEVVVKAPYMVLGDYFKALEELPIIFTIESVVLRKFENIDAGTAKEDEVASEGKLLATVLISSYTVWKI